MPKSSTEITGAMMDGAARSTGDAARREPVDDQPMRLADPRSIQILATEHWSLLSTRTLSWNESFARASMLLATLSATVVALALVAQVAEFGTGFFAFGLAVLPFLELVGLATFVRLGEANGEDFLAIQGMNRIRHAYLEIAPLLEPYLVSGRHDDLPSILAAYGSMPISDTPFLRGLHHAFVMTQGMVGIINAMVAAVFGFLLGLLVGLTWLLSVGAGVVFLAMTLGVELAFALTRYRDMRAQMVVQFAPPPDDGRALATMDGSSHGAGRR